MKIEVNEIYLMHDDGSKQGSMVAEDDDCCILRLETIVGFDNLDEVLNSIKDGYFKLYPEHKRSYEELNHKMKEKKE